MRYCFFVFYCIVILNQLSYIYYINYSDSIALKNCFLSIENFVTVRQLSSNITECKNNEFDKKPYASSYSSPYLIQLIHECQRDCLFCPRN